MLTPLPVGVGAMYHQRMVEAGLPLLQVGRYRLKLLLLLLCQNTLDGLHVAEGYISDGQGHLGGNQYCTESMPSGHEHKHTQPVIVCVKYNKYARTITITVAVHRHRGKEENQYVLQVLQPSFDGSSPMHHVKS